MDTIRNLICSFYADEISEEDFIAYMLLYNYSPREIRFVLDSKDEAQEADLVFVTLH